MEASLSEAGLSEAVPKEGTAVPHTHSTLDSYRRHPQTLGDPLIDTVVVTSEVVDHRESRHRCRNRVSHRDVVAAAAAGCIPHRRGHHLMASVALRVHVAFARHFPDAILR